MQTSNPLQDLLGKRAVGMNCGIPSYCSANKLVIDAILCEAQKTGDIALIEATSNQVNQDGGYTGMKPKDFYDYVHTIARKNKFPWDHVIIGGDHLGPLPWADEPADSAMAKAAELVSMCVKAGYQKIHLDTSMRLGDDPVDEPLSNDVIAQRSVFLYKSCIEAYEARLKLYPNSVFPVFVIGSEVPIPGGIQGDEDTGKVTSPTDFEKTLVAYRKAYKNANLEDAWDHIIAVVVQPGVEFSNERVYSYDRKAARKLCLKLKRFPDLVFEGHSTDYQPPEKLREMVEDGIAILKVGPALTFALREALFSLSRIEDIMIEDPKYRANFPEVLEKAMLADPSKWEHHYIGTEKQKRINRMFGLSDRCRYYLNDKEVDAAISRLMNNIDGQDIPAGLLHQYLPVQYEKIRDGSLEPYAKDIIRDCIGTVIRNYNYAVCCTYTRTKR